MQYKKHLAIILIGLLLNGCAGIQLYDINPIEQIKLSYVYSQANDLAAEARYLEAAEMLWNTAATLPSPSKEEMQLESARMLIKGQHLLNAHKQLIAINEEALEPQALLDKRILTATFYKQIKQPEKIVSLLPEVLINEGDDMFKKEALMLRADALKNTHRYIEGLSTYVEVKEFLNEDEYSENTDKIWQTLIAINPEDALKKLAQDEDTRKELAQDEDTRKELAQDEDTRKELAQDEDTRKELAQDIKNLELKAWLELVLLATPIQIDTTQLEQDYQRWSDEYSFLDVPDYAFEELLLRWAYFDFHPEKITLILPLTGEYASIGRTIRDGFLDAQKEAQNTSPTATQKEMQVDIYDSNQDQSIIQLYKQANRKGSDMVIGPLLKKNVDELLKHSPLPTPVITLNYASNAENIIKEGEVFQFGLYP